MLIFYLNYNFEQNKLKEMANTRARNLKAKGRKHFHVRNINKSYRKRGYLPRTQINKKAKNKILSTKTISSLRSK